MPKWKSAGNPTKFSPERTARLLEALRKGATYELACNYAGITFITFRRWYLKGEDGYSPEHIKFYEDVKLAEGEAVMKWLTIIEEAAQNGDWTAAAWKLERRYYKAYSKRTEVIDLFNQMEKFKEELKKGDLKDDEIDDCKKEENS